MLWFLYSPKEWDMRSSMDFAHFILPQVQKHILTEEATLYERI